jgi:hypothetical protein
MDIGHFTSIIPFGSINPLGVAAKNPICKSTKRPHGKNFTFFSFSYCLTASGSFSRPYCNAGNCSLLYLLCFQKYIFNV